jgi:hypothetical protein
MKREGFEQDLDLKVGRIEAWSPGSSYPGFYGASASQAAA